MAPAALLDPKPGERVLDLCAAPGGKSTQLAGKMQGRGLLVCNEISPKRAKILASNIERLGIANALVLNEHPQRLEARFEGFFDKILVDAPCSGEGMFRKEEAAVTDWSEETVFMCARRQAEILHSAALMLRPGGRLVYSTCTFSPEENEGSVSEFLKTHPDFSIEAVDAPWFSPGRPDWIECPAPGLEQTFRLWPHRLLGEGHYCAVLRKAGNGDGAELPLEPAAKLPKELADFCRETGAAIPEGKPILFGQTVYLAPSELPSLKGLHVLRAGLELGEVRKNRFEPAHAWALWQKSLPANRLQLVKRRRQHSEGNARELCDLFHEQNLLSAGNCLNLHQRVLRQSRDLNSAARRRILRKESGVHLVHGREVVHIAEKNGGLDDIFHRKSRLRQNSLNIGQGLMGLLCDTPRSEATSRGVYGQLPGCDDQITGTDSL